MPLTANEYNVVATDIALRREGIARLDFLHDDPRESVHGASILARADEVIE